MKFNRKHAAQAKRDPRLLTPAQRDDDALPAVPNKPSREPLRGKTPKQTDYIKAIKAATLTFGVGPAGTGKTYIAGALAAEALLNGDVERIIITRPAVEAGEKLGFLPGEIDDKYEPYIAAFRGVLTERLGKGHVDYLMKSGKIIASPLAYMRGLTFRDSFVIMDEAQNATPVQMKLFLTRIGEGAKVVINGDIEQQDIAGASGLTDAIRKISFIPEVRVTKFGAEDVVRSGICQEIVRAYASHANS